jgi:hypothetical protein
VIVHHEESAPVAVPLRTQYHDAQTAYTAASNRLAALSQKGLTAMLSEDEESEQLRCERRLANLQPVLDRLERDLMHEQDKLDIALVTEQ